MIHQHSHPTGHTSPTQGSTFFTTRPPAAGFRWTAPGRSKGLGGNIPYSHNSRHLSPILVLIQHKVENCFIATHQICDPNQSRWRTPCVKMQNTHAHVSTHIFQTIWLNMPYKLYLYCETIRIRKLGLLPSPFIYRVHN